MIFLVEFCGSGSSRNNVMVHYRSRHWPWQQQNQRLGAIVEGYGLVAQSASNEFVDNILPDEDTFPLDDSLYVQLGAEVESEAPDFTAVPDGLEQVFFRDPLPLDSLP